MVAACAFCGSKKGPEARTYHKFPLNDKEILQSWLQHMGLGTKFVPKKHSLLCSDHFEGKCFQQDTNNKCLRIGSIPTLFGEYKATCVYCHAVKGHDEKRSFRKFPLDNPKLLEKWVAAMKLTDFIPTGKNWLCSDHFDEKCFRSSGRGLVLKANAAPTLFSSEVSGGTSVVQQENISNTTDAVDDINGNQSTRQHGAKHISSEFSTPPSKIRRTGSLHTSTSIHSKNDSVMDCSSGMIELIERCDENVPRYTSSAAEKLNSPVRSKMPESPRSIEKSILQTKHDHQCELTPMTMRKKFIQQQQRIRILMKQSHVQKQHISRLQKKVTSLKEIVSELRKTRAIPNSGLECLDSIASTDVSQFLKRFINNQNKLTKENNDENNNPKKRKWKCQRKNKKTRHFERKVSSSS